MTSSTDIMRYETDNMAKLKALLSEDHDDLDIDIFKACLISLECQGFTLSREESYSS